MVRRVGALAGWLGSIRSACKDRSDLTIWLKVRRMLKMTLLGADIEMARMIDEGKLRSWYR